MSVQDYGRVALLLGGWSAEREVSLRSGEAAYQALCRLGVDVTRVDPRPGELQQLAGFDRAFIMLHGRGGEDGVIQGALEALGVPYTGTGVLGSALGMDKLRTKLAWRGANLPTPGFELLRADSDFDAVWARLGEADLMVKPSREGSSIGMSKVAGAAELAAAYRAAADYDAQVIAEAFVQGEEYTVAVLDGQALPVIRLETTRRFYDYEAKYETDDTRYHCPCGLSAEDEAHMQALALEAFDVVDGHGWGRIDVMRDRQGRNWLLEVNTVPGMTDHSLVPKAAQAAGIDFDQLILRILAGSRRAR